MKKRFSIFTVITVGFLMMAVGVFASGDYFNWGGTPAYEETLVIFEDLENGIISKDKAINSLKEANGKLSEEKDSLQEKLNDKNASSIDKEIIKSKLESLVAGANKENGLGNKYPYILGELNKYAKELDSDSKLEPQDEGGKSDQLKQAEIDMKDVHDKAKELQSKMDENGLSSDPDTEDKE